MTEISVASEQGFRSTMEDRYIISLDLLQDGGTVQMYAVFDGHGGSGVVTVLHRYFEDVLREIILQQKKLATDLSGALETDLQAVSFVIVDFKQALQRAFAHCDEMIDKEYAERDKTGDFDCSDSGSTAAVVLVVNNKDVYCANVGDTEVVLGNWKKELTVLTSQHKPSLLEERKRIQSAGGFVTQVGGTFRVNASLAVSRAFGNCLLTNHNNKKVIDGVPDVATATLNAGDILIIACDGLWDVFQYGEALQDSLKFFEPGETKNCAKFLTNKAIKERNSRDNVTTIIVKHDGAGEIKLIQD